MKHALTFVLLLVVAGSAAAQKSGPGDEAFDGPEPERMFRIEHGWREFEKGAWVEVRVVRREGDKRTERTERRTLRGTENDRTAMVAVTDLSRPSETVLQSVEDVCLPQDEVKYERFDPSERGGVEQRCSVFSNVESDAAKRTGETFRFWVGTYVPTPSSILRSERRRADGSTVVRDVEDFNRFVVFSGRRVMGTAFREVETFAGEAGVIETEEIESPDVPGGLVSRRGKGWIVRDGVKHEVATEEVATAFGEDALELDVKTRRACDDVRALFRYMPSGWGGFGVGSSTVTRCESRHVEGANFRLDRTTLKAVKPGGWTMGYEALEQWHKASEIPKNSPQRAHDMGWNSCYARWAHVKHLGTETVNACGKDWPCDLFAVVVPSPAFGNAGPLHQRILDYRVWRCTAFPVNDGVVRRDFAWGQRGKQTVMTETATVIDLDRKCRIGETDFSCFVIKSVHDDDKAASLSETERWICPAVPGAQVRQESWKVSGGKRESTGVWEVIEVDARKP